MRCCPNYISQYSIFSSKVKLAWIVHKSRYDSNRESNVWYCMGQVIQTTNQTSKISPIFHFKTIITKNLSLIFIGIAATLQLTIINFFKKIVAYYFVKEICLQFPVSPQDQENNATDPNQTSQIFYHVVLKFSDDRLT